MTSVIHEMLRKTRQGNTTQQKDKATQHNSPKAVIFQRKNSASGGCTCSPAHCVEGIGGCPLFIWDLIYEAQVTGMKWRKSVSLYMYLINTPLGVI